MKRVLLGGALALVLAAPAFASPLVGSDTNYSQSQGQNAFGGSASAGAVSGSKSHASSASLNHTSVQNTTQSLNQQELDNQNVAAQGQSADNNGNSFTSDDDNKTEVYAVSYTDAAPPTVAASIGDGVVVTTWGVKVLGPVFGMTDQHVHYLPKAVEAAAQLSYLATTNDGTYEGERVQFAHIAAVCAHDAELAEQLNLGCK